MKKILVIDDDEYIRRYYSKLLTLNHYAVETAGNAPEAFEKAKFFNPDLILLDIIMPITSGVRVLEKLKSDPLTSLAPVIILTNLGDEEILNEVMEKGAATYIVKANSSNEKLLEEIKKYINQNPKS